MSDANLMAESYAEEASNNNIAHDEENKPFCKLCGKKFAQSSYIKAHMRLHTGEKPFSCSFCPKRFSDCSNWKKHERIHIRQMGINLDKVPQSPSSPSKSASFSLDSYQPAKCKSDVTTNGNLTCKICNKSFSNASSLATHKRIHTGDRPYRCHTCGKSFTQIGTLRTHERIHTGQKPYTCKFCGQTFAQSGSFRMHERRHMMDMLHKCPICPVKFSRWEDAKEHLATHPEISGTAEFIKNQMAAAAQELNDDETLPHIESFAAARPELHLEQFPPPGFPFPHQLTPFLNVSTAALHLGGPFPTDLPTPVGMFTTQMIKTEAMSNMVHANSPTDLRQPMVTTSQPSPIPEHRTSNIHENGDIAISSTTTARDRKYSSDSHTSVSTPDANMDNGNPRNEQEEKASMETDNPTQESDRKVASEESSVISDHSDNGHAEEGSGIKSRNLHGRLLSNSRKQKHPMRRYSGSVLSTGSLDPDTSTHPTQSLMNESDSIYSGDQSVEEFLDISSVNGKLYRCDHCHIIFEDCTLYLLHNGFHSHDNDPFKCVICRTSCRDRIEFNCHLTSHIK